MRFPTILLAIFILMFAWMFSACTSTSEPDAVSDLAIHTEYNPIIIPYYMFDGEGLEVPTEGYCYHILNSREEVAALPQTDVFFFLQKEIYNNFDFSDSSVILVSVLGEIKGEAPHCTVSYSYNQDKTANVIYVKWKEGIVPIEDYQSINKDRTALIQFAIGVGKISSNTPIIIEQIFS